MLRPVPPLNDVGSAEVVDGALLDDGRRHGFGGAARAGDDERDHPSRNGAADDRNPSAHTSHGLGSLLDGQLVSFSIGPPTREEPFRVREEVRKRRLGRSPAGAGRVHNLLQTCGFVVGGGVEPVPGDPDGADAAAQVLGVAFAVVLKRLLVFVELPAVGLDDQAVLGEVGVDPPAVDEDVDLGRREVVLLDEDQEVVLEDGVGGIGGGLGEGPDELGAGVEWVAGDDVLEGCSGGGGRSRRSSLTSRVSCFLVSRGAMSRTVRARVVVGTPCWRVTSRALARPATMGGDARTLAASLGGHLQRELPSRQQSPQARRPTHGSGQRPGHTPTPRRERVRSGHRAAGRCSRPPDAPDDPRPGLQPALNQALPDPEFQQLPPSDMPVLTPRQVQDRRVVIGS